MPTGGGKSIIYQLPALLRPGLAIIISPLISLMRDQVAALKKRGIRAATLNSTSPTEEVVAILAQISEMIQMPKLGENAALKLLYVSPEQVATDRFRTILGDLRAQNSISLVAVDEAHCISLWGHDFRTSYRKLSELKALIQGMAPLIACTATATPRVLTDIMTSLKLEDPAVVRLSFNRPNLSYQVKFTDKLATDVLEDVVVELRRWIDHPKKK
eukprot:GHVT01099832.1.p1 GENE.GHVT01099832.1~~GHVT01099832.1.p1  ORF type:complete len:215 (+),score=25.76 GHVT01099832.1:873-1517(+)